MLPDIARGFYDIEYGSIAVRPDGGAIAYAITKDWSLEQEDTPNRRNWYVAVLEFARGEAKNAMAPPGDLYECTVLTYNGTGANRYGVPVLRLAQVQNGYACDGVCRWIAYDRIEYRAIVWGRKQRLQCSVLTAAVTRGQAPEYQLSAVAMTDVAGAERELCERSREWPLTKDVVVVDGRTLRFVGVERAQDAITTARRGSDWGETEDVHRKAMEKVYGRIVIE
jgi:hypothetical protein